MNSTDKNKMKIREVLTQCLDNTKKMIDITENTQLELDLHMDSIVYISFVVMIEDQFNIVIPDENLSMMEYTTYGELEKMIIDVIEHANNSQDDVFDVLLQNNKIYEKN